MQRSLKFLACHLVSVGFSLMVVSCQQRTPDNPNPEYPPLTIKVTLPPGSHKLDSATFRRIMQEPNLPDSLPLPKK